MKTNILILSSFLAATLSARAVISVVNTSTYSQDFDSLASSGTGNAWLNDSTISGWYLFQQAGGGTAIASYNAGDGSSSTGNFYSFGGADSGDRALGGVGSGGAYFGSPSSGSIAGWIAVSFVNSSGSTFSGFMADWNGEQWRNGGNTSPQTMVFEYGFGATFGSVSTWHSPGGTFDWSSPVATSTAGAVDGNTAGLVTGVGGTINSLTWANGETLWLRWVERNDAGNDHGLAIDSFSFAAQVPTAIPVSGHTGLLLAIPLLGLFTLRRFALRTF